MLPAPPSIHQAAHLPVLGLGDSLGVAFSELALRVHGCDGGAELGHGVEVGGKTVHHLHHVLG